MNVTCSACLKVNYGWAWSGKMEVQEVWGYEPQTIKFHGPSHLTDWVVVHGICVSSPTSSSLPDKPE